MAPDNNVAAGILLTELALNSIRLDGGTQPRVGPDLTVVAIYAEAMRLGAKFPAVTVFDDREHLWLGGGFHRVQARMMAGFVTIDADLRDGTLRDAVLFSVGENAEHGQPRTNDDKRRAVVKLLSDSEWRRQSDAWIAGHVKVDDRTVASLRHELYPPALSPEVPEMRTAHRGGQSYQINVTKIGQRSPGGSPPGMGPGAATGYRELDYRPRYLAVAEALNSIRLAHQNLPDPRTAAAEIGTYDIDLAAQISLWWTKFGAELRQRIGRTG